MFEALGVINEWARGGAGAGRFRATVSGPDMFKQLVETKNVLKPHCSLRLQSLSGGVIYATMLG